MNRRSFLSFAASCALAAVLAGCSLSTDPDGFGEEEPPKPPPVIRFAAMGDIMLGTEEELPPDGGVGFFQDVKPYLVDRDVIFGNLEGPLTDLGEPTKDTSTGRSYVFRTPPSYGAHLKDAGFTMLSLANNHVNDYGPEGRQQTLDVLDSLGIGYTGAPGQISIQDLGSLRVAYIGLAPNSGCQDLNDIPGAAALVREAAGMPDTLVVVSVHGGAEGPQYMRVPDGPETFLGEDRGDLRRLSREVIDAGADLVIGHGPHVPRGVELYKDRLIAYSLGNFATAAGINVQGVNGLAPLLLADLSPDGTLLSMRIISFRQVRNEGPKLDPGDEAASVMRALSRELLAPSQMAVVWQSPDGTF